MSFVATIGLEIHVELKTNTKMFCSCKNDSSEVEVNVNICPVCVGHPGTLPTINFEAVRNVLKVGLALNSKLADYTEFDRKNYFYPDLPKGYQVSQFAFPLVSGGSLGDVQITRIHLEEDTARSMHDKDPEWSTVDFNRSGIPLMELVTEPVIHSSEIAGKFARDLQILLKTLNVSTADMERGEMRVEANISVAEENATLGTKVEVKNLNSFRSMEKAIEYEIKRHIDIISKGGIVTQETRGWDDNRQVTFSQRAKENANDYRYFPDPDLPKIKISELEEFSENLLRSDMPELPKDKFLRYKNIGIKDSDSEQIASSPHISILFDKVLKIYPDNPNLCANYLINNLLAIKLTEEEIGSLDAEKLASIFKMANDRMISSNSAVTLIAALVSGSVVSSVEEYAKAFGLLQVSDETALESVILSVIAENSTAVDSYKKGKEASLQYLVGQCMRITKGSGNPSVIAKLLKDKLYL